MSRTFRMRKGHHREVDYVSLEDRRYAGLGLTDDQVLKRSFSYFHRDHNHTYLNTNKSIARQTQRLYRVRLREVLRRTLKRDPEDQSFDGYSFTRNPLLRYHAYS